MGANGKFHLTMTDAIVRIMARRVETMEEKNWRLFLQQNTDLVEDFESALHSHYSKDLLFSTVARTTLVSPDIKPI